ncbi:hypothetical protein ACLKA6_017143 [Drosophila palustris]
MVTKTDLFDLCVVLSLGLLCYWKMDLIEHHVKMVAIQWWKHPAETELKYNGDWVLIAYALIATLSAWSLCRVRKKLSEKTNNEVKEYIDADAIFRYQIWTQLVNLNFVGELDWPGDEIM